MNDDKQRTINPKIQEQYDRALADGISKIQLIQPQYVGIWRVSKRLGSDIHVFNYNCHVSGTKVQVARYNLKNGILTVEYKHHFLISKKGHYPDIITIQAEGKKALQRLFNKRRDELIYVIDGAESRKNNNLYYVEHQLVTKLRHQPSITTLNRLEEIFKYVTYCDDQGVNRWEEEIKKSRIESVIRSRKKKEYGERVEPPTLTIE